MTNQIDLERLAEFLVNAKKARYTGDCEAYVDPKTLELTESTFQGDNLFYIDRHVGLFRFCGMEEVRLGSREGPTIWTMASSGGMSSEFNKDISYANSVYRNCLIPALRGVTIDVPFRGQRFYRSQSHPCLIYSNRIDGDIKRFKLFEEVIDLEKEKIIYMQDFVGGLVISK